MMLKEEAGGSVCLIVKTSTMVDLFDKAVAEGGSNHCGNEVRR